MPKPSPKPALAAFDTLAGVRYRALGYGQAQVWVWHVRASLLHDSAEFWIVVNLPRAEWPAWMRWVMVDFTHECQFQGRGEDVAAVIPKPQKVLPGELAKS